MFSFFSHPQNVLLLSSRILGAGLALLVAGIYGAYLYGGHLPIPALVSFHAMTIIGPTLLKIGYVMRLLTQHHLRQRLTGVSA